MKTTTEGWCEFAVHTSFTPLFPHEKSFWCPHPESRFDSRGVRTTTAVEAGKALLGSSVRLNSISVDQMNVVVFQGRFCSIPVEIDKKTFFQGNKLKLVLVFFM